MVKGFGDHFSKSGNRFCSQSPIRGFQYPKPFTPFPNHKAFFIFDSPSRKSGKTNRPRRKE